MKLAHRNVRDCDFQNVSNFFELVDLINSKDDVVVKGYHFEVFVEFYLRYFNKFNRITPVGTEHKTGPDHGVDFVATKLKPGMQLTEDGENEENCTFQAKFRNPFTHKPLDHNDLRSFFEQSTRLEWPHRVSYYKNMYLVTNILSRNNPTSHTAYQDRGSINEITGDIIAAETNPENHSNFWNDFHESIRETIEDSIQTIVRYEPFKHQQRSFEKIKESKSKRAQIIAATGSGKTLIQTLAMDETFGKKGKRIVLFGYPYLKLEEQNFLATLKQSHTSWDGFLVGSINDLNRSKIPNVKEDKFQFTLNPDILNSGIVERIQGFLSSDQNNLAIFSTYHSIHKVLRACKQIDLEIDLLIADEAHNLVSNVDPERVDAKNIKSSKTRVLYDEFCKIKTRLFFTATSKNSEDYGMDNEKLFGKVIDEIPAVEMAMKGHIVKPELLFVEPTEDFISRNLNRIENYELSMLDRAFKGLDEMFDQVRLIVSVSKKDLVYKYSETLKNHPDYQDVDVFPLTSYEDLQDEYTEYSRDEIIEKFRNSNRAILIQIDILSEGIDIPETTAVLPLKNMSVLKTIQFIGRALRLFSEDREKLRNKELKAWGSGDPDWRSGWKKPTGLVVCPVYRDGDKSQIHRQVSETVYAMRQIGFNAVEQLLFGEYEGNLDTTASLETGEEAIRISRFFYDQDDIKLVLEEIKEEQKKKETKAILTNLLVEQNIDIRFPQLEDKIRKLLKAITTLNVVDGPGPVDFKHYLQSANKELKAYLQSSADLNDQEFYLICHSPDKFFNVVQLQENIDRTNEMVSEVIEEKIELLELYLAPSAEERKKNGEVFTPRELIEEMLDKLPQEVWSNPDFKWLDPCVGVGNFMVVILPRLMEGLKDWEPDEEKRKKHIIENMLYMVELMPKNSFICKNILDWKNEYNLNLWTEDFLEWETDLKFDVVVGNPPYNNPTKSSSEALYIKFIEKSHIFNQDAILCFVCPNSWLGRLKDDKNGLRYKLIDLNFYSICWGKKVSEYFKNMGIGIDVCYFCTTTNKNTLCILDDGNNKLSIDYYSLLWVPLDLSKFEIIKNFWSIEQKHPGHFKEITGFRPTSKNVSDKNEKSYIYPLANTSAQYSKNVFYYSKIKHPLQNIKKVIFSMSGYSKPFYDDGKLGLSHHSRCYLVEDENHAQRLINFLNSDNFQIFADSKGSSSTLVGIGKVANYTPLIK